MDRGARALRSNVIPPGTNDDDGKIGHLYIPEPNRGLSSLADAGAPVAVVPLEFVVVGLLLVAAWRDFATRTIPDAISLAILVVGMVDRLSIGWMELASSAGVGLLVFLVLLPCHARGLFGGGDVKLLTALSFGLPPWTSYQMLSTVILAGGVLALAYIGLRRILNFIAPRSASPLRHDAATLRIVAVESWRIRKGAPLPYAIAIAAGASLVLIGHQGA